MDKNTIIMKPGFKIEGGYYKGEVMAVFNLENLNVVSVFACKRDYKFLRSDQCVGVWQPKGTKLKQLNK